MRASVDIDMPPLRLEVANTEACEQVAAEAVAAGLVSRIRAGVDARGLPLPRPEDGGRPLVRTGRMLSQVRAVRGVVTVDGDRAAVARILASRGGPAERVFFATEEDEREAARRVDRVLQASLEVGR